MYPELKDKRVGLGVTNIVIEFLEMTNRFVFTEDKLEIKERMVNQFKASDKGFTENKVDGRGKVKLAKDIIVGDILIDDKGNPTKVRKTISGVAPMYEVKTDKNNFLNYTVTSNHILTLKILNIEQINIRYFMNDILILLRSYGNDFLSSLSS